MYCIGMYRGLGNFHGCPRLHNINCVEPGIGMEISNAYSLFTLRKVRSQGRANFS